MAAMGAMPMPGGGGGSPEDLLPQIVDLCSQYVQGGGDPNMLMDQLQQAWQGAADPNAQGGMPPDGGGMPPDMPSPSSPPSSNDGGHPFANASAMAIDDMKKKSKAY